MPPAARGRRDSRPESLEAIRRGEYRRSGLNLEVEVHVGALRAAYPDMYDQIAASATSELSANGSIDRIARQQVYSQTGTSSSILQDQRPTLSRTWIQPWAFDLEDDQEFGERMRATYPNGLLLVSTGATFLSARDASLTKEWTWAGTHEGFGLYPPSIGDIVVPFQKRYNDMANILHEFMDRCSSGVTLANADLIDTKSIEKYQNRYSTAAKQLKNCEMVVTGPWPPYHFLPGKVRTVAGDS